MAYRTPMFHKNKLLSKRGTSLVFDMWGWFDSQINWTADNLIGTSTLCLILPLCISTVCWQDAVVRSANGCLYPQILAHPLSQCCFPPSLSPISDHSTVEQCSSTVLWIDSRNLTVSPACTHFLIHFLTHVTLLHSEPTASSPDVYYTLRNTALCDVRGRSYNSQKQL